MQDTAFRLPNKILLLVIGHYPRNCWPSGEIELPDAPLLPPLRMCPRPRTAMSGRRGSAFNRCPSAPDPASAATATHHAAAPCGSDRRSRTKAAIHDDGSAPSAACADGRRKSNRKPGKSPAPDHKPRMLASPAAEVDPDQQPGGGGTETKIWAAGPFRGHRRESCY